MINALSELTWWQWKQDRREVNPMPGSEVRMEIDEYLILNQPPSDQILPMPTGVQQSVPGLKEKVQGKEKKKFQSN